MKRFMKRFAKWTSILVLVLAALALVGGLFLHEPRPSGTPGPEAEALAERVLASIDDEAWQDTAAVSWNFGGRNEHLWDRERHLARVRWDDLEVLLRIHDRSGVALEGGRGLHGDDALAALDQAHAHFINDSFWLNPVSKMHDEGVRRELVRTEEGDALLVRYTSGGRTPGDAYLWHLDANARPVSWQMWVSILPIGGVSCTWESWSPLATGALVSREHDFGPLTLALSNIRGASTLAALGEADAFRLLEE